MNVVHVYSLCDFIGYTLLQDQQNQKHGLKNGLGFPLLFKIFGPAKLVSAEYAKFAGLNGHVWRILKMSSEGVLSRQTLCLARLNQVQGPVNRCPAKSLIFVGHFTVKCSVRIQDVRRRTKGSPGKMSGETQKNFAQTESQGRKSGVYVQQVQKDQPYHNFCNILVDTGQIMTTLIHVSCHESLVVVL